MHEADVLTFLESLAKDLRFGVRMLVKRPAFTAIALVALGVGIGVNTAVFTAFKALLLQPLDAKNPRQLVNIYRSTEQKPYDPDFSYPDYEFYRDNAEAFSGLVATAGDELVLSGGDGIDSPSNSLGTTLAGAIGFRFPSMVHGGSEFVSSVDVSENYFAVLGVSASRGRVFLPRDAKDLNTYPAVLISENYWKRRFNGNIKILGKPIKLNGVSFDVMGVTPHDFLGTNVNVPDFWLPMGLRHLVYKGADPLQNREDFCCALYGRLGSGISLSEAQGQMALLADRLRSLHAPHSEGSEPVKIKLTPGSHFRPITVSSDPGLAFAALLIMSAVGLVLLIACANVASLQLSRAAARQREIGVRLSVGASRSRVIRQLLTESVLLGMAAGVFSMLMAWGALRLLMLEVAASLPLEWGNIAMHVEPDAHVFAYVFAISLIAGVLFGLVPAFEASRPDLTSVLKEEGARFALRLRSARLRELLLGTQVAVCLLLLVGAGLLIRGSIRAMTINPGYETKKVIWLNVNFPPGSGYTHAKQLDDMRQLRDGIRDLRSVQSVTLGRAPDGGGLRTAAFGSDGDKPGPANSARTLYYGYVGSSYFQTLRIPLVSGRSFEGSSTSQAVAVLSESAAEELWPGSNPIGRTLTLDGRGEFHLPGELIPTGQAYHVVAVAKDTRGIIPGGEDSKKVYLPLPPGRADDVPLLIRIGGDPKVFLAELNKEVQAVDGNLVIYSETLEGLLTSTPTFVISRLSALFASIIGFLGLFLACVGIYGAVSYAVVRRTREIGIRMALGARKRDVLSLVLRESGRPVMIGILVGLAGALAASRLLRALLFGMGAFDPISFAGVAGLFLLIALTAAYFPARRATLVDPMRALRCE